MNEFRLPDLGEGLTEAEIVRWLVCEGEEVAVDQPLVEVETGKSIVELPSPFAGTVLHRGGAEGQTLPVGAVVVAVGAPGERWIGRAPAEAAPSGVDAPIVGRLSEDAQDLPPPGRPGATLALPLVRKLAASLGVDLRSVTGSGPGGRITRADVMAAAAHPSAPDAAKPDAAERRDERRPLSMLRRTIAANLTRAWNEIPMVTALDEVDAGRLVAARTALQARHGVAVPIDALVVAAVVPALRAFPEFNSSLEGDTLVLHHRYDIGIAVDTADGLLVAVLVDAGSMRLLQLAAELRRLGEAARARTLPASALSGQTFTVSNIGAIGGGHGTPLVPLGTVGILSVGRIAPKPVVRGSTVDVAPVMPLSLSYDHRVIDGATGRRFMTMVAEHLAEPALLLA
jgi:pyruvate dehydrogenase E2 component (dihydrolipoyllysine-residue acetyltransferase)